MILSTTLSIRNANIDLYTKN